MYINFETLEEYLKKEGCIVNISIDTDDAGLKFTLGRAKDYGSRVELMEAGSLMDILVINEIIGVGSKVEKILKERTGDAEERDHQIEGLIYSTLSKYIARLFYSSDSKNPFPEIKWLSIHAHHYITE